jgi:hypothetical protein
VRENVTQTRNSQLKTDGSPAIAMFGGRQRALIKWQAWKMTRNVSGISPFDDVEATKSLDIEREANDKTCDLFDGRNHVTRCRLVASTSRHSFEAASIKRNDSNGPGFLGVNGDRFTATNFPLRIFIRNAFRLQPAQLVGGPDWLDE